MGDLPGGASPSTAPEAAHAAERSIHAAGGNATRASTGVSTAGTPRASAASCSESACSTASGGSWKEAIATAAEGTGRTLAVDPKAVKAELRCPRLGLDSLKAPKRLG